MKDALIVGLIALTIPMAFAVARLWWWAGFWLGVAGLLGLVEAIAYYVTGKTLSQQFTAFMRKHKVAGWGLLGLLFGAIVGLILHLVP